MLINSSDLPQFSFCLINQEKSLHNNHFFDFLWWKNWIMKAKNVQTSECKELLLLFNSSSSFCLSSINVKMVLLAYLKELQRAHHQLQFIEDRLEILRKSHPITMEGLLSKFSRSKLVLHQLRWTTSGAILENQFGGGSHTNVFHLRSFVELTRLIFFTVFILSVYILYDQNRYSAFQIDLKCPLNPECV